MFFQETGTGAEAKEICADCPVIISCLDWAVRHGEQGIWGGVGPERRTLLRAALSTGNALAYHTSLMEVLQDLGRQLRGHEDERPEVPEGACGRCGARRRAGRLPADRNGPGARCGLAATYNKGCRCDPCVEAKSAWQKAQKQKRKRRGRGSFAEAYARERERFDGKSSPHVGKTPGDGG